MTRVPDPGMVDYLRQNQGAYPIQDLKNALLAVGHPPEEVEEAALLAARPAEEPESPYEAPSVGFWVRVGAYCVDALVIAVIAVPATWQLSAPARMTMSLLAGALVNLTYFAVLTGRYGRTIGKALAGARVVAMDGSPPGFKRAFVRALGGLASWALAGTPFLGVASNELKRGAHDYLAGTRVVYDPEVSFARKTGMASVALVPLSIALLFMLYILAFFFAAGGHRRRHGGPATISTRTAPLPALTGRWNGVFGPDRVREVLMLAQHGPSLSGTSSFEKDDGQALTLGRGVISGTVQSASDIAFTIARDSMTFEWKGAVNADRTILSGRFTGYSNDGTYAKGSP